MGIIAREILALKDEEVEIPEMTRPVPFDSLAFHLDFDVDWAYDSATNAIGFILDIV